MGVCVCVVWVREELNHRPGLPEQIRSDNGPEFASQFAAQRELTGWQAPENSP